MIINPPGIMLGSFQLSSSIGFFPKTHFVIDIHQYFVSHPNPTPTAPQPFGLFGTCPHSKCVWADLPHKRKAACLTQCLPLYIFIYFLPFCFLFSFFVVFFFFHVRVLPWSCTARFTATGLTVGIGMFIICVTTDRSARDVRLPLRHDLHKRDGCNAFGSYPKLLRNSVIIQVLFYDSRAIVSLPYFI